MKRKPLHIFVRFGGLDLKNQKSYTKSYDGLHFHSPPASRGFYAMPKIAQEFFLISSIDKFQPSTVPKERKLPEDMSYEECENYWEEHTERYKKALSAMRKEFVKKNGEIWASSW